MIRAPINTTLQVMIGTAYHAYHLREREVANHLRVNVAAPGDGAMAVARRWRGGGAAVAMRFLL